MEQGYIYNTTSEKYIVWHIQGGLGKNIAATSLISGIKEKYLDRKLIMIVSYPEGVKGDAVTPEPVSVNIYALYGL